MSDDNIANIAQFTFITAHFSFITAYLCSDSPLF